MEDEHKKYLLDIKLAIDNINIHLNNTRDYSLFDRSITIRSAIKYEFSIIGEAMYELLKLKPDFIITDAAKIISFRNKMVHEYDAIDNGQVWNIIINYLPRLKVEVIELLEK
jgi:uncharacterized protein with HEPN domain